MEAIRNCGDKIRKDDISSLKAVKRSTGKNYNGESCTTYHYHFLQWCVFE